MNEDQIPEPDRVDDAPHPRETVELFGQTAAELEFLNAHQTGRLHHAWLLTGPRGIGKATLAWRIARFLVSQSPNAGPSLFGDTPEPSLQMDPDNPVFRRAAALAEPGIALCRRGWDDKAKRLKTVLTVDEVRKLKAHFGLSATDGGWRAAIVDAADEMNTAAANALLKLLEEPPANTVLLLVCHQPAKLLPTIRSRCRVLRLKSLSEEDLGRALAAAGADIDRIGVLHQLSGGSPGDAIRMINADAAELYPRLVRLLDAAPRMDRGEMGALSAGTAGRAGIDKFSALTELWLLLISRLTRAGASAGTTQLIEAERAPASRLVPDARAARIWAELHQTLSGRIEHARAVNLDPELVILDMFTATEKAASRVLSAYA